MPGDTLQQHFEQAMALHRGGRFAEAERFYRDVLRTRPQHVEARHLLGVLRFQQGRSSEALELIAAALKAKPDYSEAHYNRGNILSELGRYEEALASYEQTLALSADYAEALQNRGNVLLRLRRYADALGSFEQVLLLHPAHADAHNNRGTALKELGRTAEALASYEQALKLRPGYVEALANRGHVLLELGRHLDALASYETALALRPDDVEALSGRGSAQFELNRLDEALASYDRALALNPDHADTLCNRGAALEKRDQYEEALAGYERALAAEPDHVYALYRRAGCLAGLNRLPQAHAEYRRALVLDPDNAQARFALCMSQLPIIYSDEAEIDERRAHYERELRLLCEESGRGTEKLVKGIGSHQPFYLAYQGRDDRELQRVYGSLLCRLMAEHFGAAKVAAPPAADEPIRVGVVTGYFWRHSVWKIPTKGWLTELDRKRFEIFGYHTTGRNDVVTQEAQALCERFVQGPMSIGRWRDTILADAPHVLLYPDIGMDGHSAALAAMRLAPVQCMSLGHPETSGFSTLDYFLTSDLMEPPNGEDHYVERLIRLPNISIYYEPLNRAPVALDRAQLGLRPDATVFWCGQSLFKFLPQFDQVFARIAQGVPGCQFAFIEYGRNTHVTDQFRRRLERAFAAFGLRADAHCVVLPRLDQPSFAAAIGQCDIVLDSTGWSGFNSTMEGLDHDLPIVTLAGPLMRSRHTTGVLRMMGVTETIAETVDDYVATAVRLGIDREWRNAMKARMAKNRHRVFRDRSCIRALEDFLDRAVREGRP